MIFRSRGDKIEKMKEWGGVLETTETYTKVPTPSGLIEETVKIVKIISYLFNFPSHLSQILTHKCSFLSTDPLTDANFVC